MRIVDVIFDMNEGRGYSRQNLISFVFMFREKRRKN